MLIIDAGANSLSCQLLQLPIVDDEMRKAAGDSKEEDTAMTATGAQRLVTADGTYATQSAFSTATPAKKAEDRQEGTLLKKETHFLEVFF